jgi:cytochrome b pre-mRNA-processing protein 3
MGCGPFPCQSAYGTASPPDLAERPPEVVAAGSPEGAPWKERLVGLLSLIRRGRHERVGFELYGAAVAAARDPFLYTALGVPDTLDGRFDMVGLHTFLLIQRLKGEVSPGPALAQAVFDAMFSDMDVNLREMGVGDLSVGRKVRVMWEAFHGRAAAYASAMIAGDMAALDAALARNVWRGEPPPDGAMPALRRVMLAQEAHLAAQSLSAIAGGAVGFLSAEEASR